jgi:dolichol-phosphate mannosyltransferase
MNEVLVIIPTYNEGENIIKIIESIFTIHQDINILIVDDNSPDGTSSKVKELISKYNNKLNLITRESKMGLGTAYLRGFNWAINKDFNYIISMDADFSHNPSDILRLYEKCVYEKNDICIGSRYIKGINVVNWPLQRIILSYFASLYVRLITGMNIMDPTSGFVCYSIKSLKQLDFSKIKFNGYAFQIEMKFKLWKKNFKLREHQIIFVNRKSGKSKMDKNIIFEAIFGVIRLKLNSIFKIDE